MIAETSVFEHDLLWEFVEPSTIAQEVGELFAEMPYAEVTDLIEHESEYRPKFIVNALSAELERKKNRLADLSEESTSLEAQLINVKSEIELLAGPNDLTVGISPERKRAWKDYCAQYGDNYREFLEHLPEPGATENLVITVAFRYNAVEPLISSFRNDFRHKFGSAGLQSLTKGYVLHHQIDFITKLSTRDS